MNGDTKRREMMLVLLKLFGIFFFFWEIGGKKGGLGCHAYQIPRFGGGQKGDFFCLVCLFVCFLRRDPWGKFQGNGWGCLVMLHDEQKARFLQRPP